MTDRQTFIDVKIPHGLICSHDGYDYYGNRRAHTINVWVMDCCISFTQENHVFNMTVTAFDHRVRKMQMLITF